MVERDKKQNDERNTVAKFEGVWVKIEGVMANPKNRQMWDFGSWKVEFGIGSSGMELQRCQGSFRENRVETKEIWPKNRILYFFFSRKGSATARK